MLVRVLNQTYLTQRRPLQIKYPYVDVKDAVGLVAKMHRAIYRGAHLVLEVPDNMK